jgi:hypothetical protein
MKKALPAFIVASALLTSQSGIFHQDHAHAATKVSSVKYVTSKQQISIDGSFKKVSTITQNGKVLFSLNEISNGLKIASEYNKKANTMTFNSIADNNRINLVINLKTNTTTLNNKKVKFNVTTVNNIPFGDVLSFVKMFGKEMIKTENTSELFISSSNLLQGDVNDAQFITGNKLLLKADTDEGALSYIVNPMTFKVEKTLSFGDSIVSKDGKKTAFIDEDGYINVYDFTSGKTVVNDTNDEPKAGLVWSNDNSKIYFLKGGNNEIVSALNLADNKITDVVTDGVKFKQDLVVLSEQPLKFAYKVESQFSTSTDPNGDYSGQDESKAANDLFAFDTTSADKKAVQLTATAAENKAFATTLANGDILYISQNTDDDSAPEKLMLIDHATGATKQLLVLADNPVRSIAKAANGDILFVIPKTKGDQVVQLTKDWTLKTLFSTTQTINSIEAMNSNSITFTNGEDGAEKVSYVNNGKVFQLTK